MKEFIHQVKQYGWYVAFCNALIDFTMKFINAKRIRISYKKYLGGRYAGGENH